MLHAMRKTCNCTMSSNRQATVSRHRVNLCYMSNGNDDK